MKKKVKKQQDVSGKIVMSIGNGMVRLALDVVLYLFIIFAAIYSCKYAYNFCYQVFGAASVTDEEDSFSMSITVYEGESTLEIADRLENYGLILNKYSFVVKSRLDKISIKPGTFIISSDMDYDEILTVISDISQSKDEDEVQDSLKEEASGSSKDDSDTANP